MDPIINPFIDDIASCSSLGSRGGSQISQLGSVSDGGFIDDGSQTNDIPPYMAYQFEEHTGRQRSQSRESRESRELGEYSNDSIESALAGLPHAKLLFGVPVSVDPETQEVQMPSDFDSAANYCNNQLRTAIETFLQKHQEDNDKNTQDFIDTILRDNTEIVNENLPIADQVHDILTKMEGYLSVYGRTEDPDELLEYNDVKREFDQQMNKVVAITQYHQLAAASQSNGTLTLLREWPEFEAAKAKGAVDKARAFCLQMIITHFTHEDLSYDQAKYEKYMYKKVYCQDGPIKIWLNAYEPFTAKNSRGDTIVFTLDLYIKDMFADATRFFQLTELDRIHGDGIKNWIIKHLSDHQQKDYGMPAPTGDIMLFSTEAGLIDFVSDSNVPHIWKRNTSDFLAVQSRVASRVIRYKGPKKICNVCPIQQLEQAIDYSCSPPRWKIPQQWMTCSDWIWYKIWNDQGVDKGTLTYMFELGLVGRTAVPSKYTAHDSVSNKKVTAGDMYNTGLVLFGKSGVGKSTVIQAALSVGFAPEDICTLRDRGGDDKFSTNEITGKRVVFCDDMTSRTNIPMDILQRLPEGGGDENMMTVEGKGENPHGIFVTQPIVLNSNEYFPPALNAEMRMQRRYIVLPFKKKSGKVGHEDKKIKEMMASVKGNFFIETQIARYATKQYILDNQNTGHRFKNEWDILGLRALIDKENKYRYSIGDAEYWAGNRDQSSIIEAIQNLVSEESDDDKELEYSKNGRLALAHLKWMVYDYQKRNDQTAAMRNAWHDVKTWRNVVNLLNNLELEEYNDEVIWPPTQHGVRYKDDKDSEYAQHCFIKGIRVRPIKEIYMRQPVVPTIPVRGGLNTEDVQRNTSFWLTEDDDHQLMLDSFGFNEDSSKVFSVVHCDQRCLKSFSAKTIEIEEQLTEMLQEGLPVLEEHRERLISLLGDSNKINSRSFPSNKRIPSIL